MKYAFALALALLAVPVHAAPQGHTGHDHAATAPAAVATVDATVRAVDPARGTINVSHGPIVAFNWPPMTMDLRLADQALAKGLAPGARVTLRIEKRSAVDYAVVGITPAP